MRVKLANNWTEFLLGASKKDIKTISSCDFDDGARSVVTFSKKSEKTIDLKDREEKKK